MARKRVEDTVPALESWDDVNQALATIADNQRAVENFEAAMQNKIDEAKAEAEARSRVFIEATKRLERQIKEFARGTPRRHGRQEDQDAELRRGGLPASPRRSSCRRLPPSWPRSSSCCAARAWTTA